MRKLVIGSLMLSGAVAATVALMRWVRRKMWE